ncbi:MAG: BREX-1 system adenine-specific DNA-methyltransferase PglX, partial [Campylobacterales bacterium]|nr:BREX-1 system adenine-specific DNA-methyltransferase PglX [Campylobacterales bacterium]
VVVANPPYMGGKGMSDRLKKYLSDNYNDVKTDLFSAFMVRNTFLTLPKGQLGFMTPFVWMFISSYEKLREFIINQKTITSLVQLEYSGFDGATVPICTFTLENSYNPEYLGGYIKLSDFKGSENQAPKTLEAIKNKDCGWFYLSSANEINLIPGSPIAYWVSQRVKEIFEKSEKLGEVSQPRVGLQTGDNDRFLRCWSEVSFNKVGLNYSNRDEAKESSLKWFPYNKGGEFQKWYGNQDYLVNWENDGVEIQNFFDEKGKLRSRPQNKEFYFQEGITWSFVSSSNFGVRYTPKGFLFDVGGSSTFPKDNEIFYITAFLTSKIALNMLKIVAPTINFQVGDLKALPIIFSKQESTKQQIDTLTGECIDISKEEWDSRETSWDFLINGLLRFACNDGDGKISSAYNAYCEYWRERFYKLHANEEELNRLFIDIYELGDELTPDIALKDITILKSESIINDNNELEFKADEIMKQFISYAVGVMFGRYSLDHDGLHIANQDESIEEVNAKFG